MTRKNTIVSGSNRSTLGHGAALRRVRRLSAQFALSAAVLAAGLSAKGATLSWDPGQKPATPTGGTGTWDLSTLDWSNATSDIAWTDTTAAGTDTAVFGGTAGTVTLGANLSALGLQFTTTGYTIAGTGTLTLGTGGVNTSTLSAGSAIINTNMTLAGLGAWNVGNSTVTANGTLGGTGGITKTGTGLLILNGANSYSGGTTITGILNAGSSTALGTGGVTINTGAGNQLQLGNGTNLTNALTINGGGVTAQGVLYVPTGNATYSGTINITAVQNAGGIFATSADSVRLTIAGDNTITSSVPVTERLGYVLISGNQSYTGGTTLANGGATIQFAKVGSMPATGAVTMSANTTLAVNAGGTNEFTTGTGAGSIAGLLAGTGGQGAAVILPTNSSIGIDTTNAPGNVTLSTAFASTSNVGLVKLGSGTLVLSAGGTYAGNGAVGFPFEVRQGTLDLVGGTNTVTGEAVVGGQFTTANGAAGYNAVLQLDSSNLAVSGFLSVGRGNGIGTVSSDVIANGSSVITSANFSGGYNGGNAANLVRGTLTLNGTSSFTDAGQFTLGESPGSNVTLTVNDSASLKNTSTGVTYIGYEGGNGTLNINGGTVTTAGEMEVAGSPASGAFAGGSGTVNQVAGNVTLGALTISRGNNNQYANSGTYNISGGTLTSTNDLLLGFAGTGLGKLNITGGTVNVATTATKWLIVGEWDTAHGEIDISGGNLNLNMGTSLKFNTQNTTGPNVVNQNGGTITFYSDNGVTVGGGGVVDLMQGGAAGSSDTYNLNGGTLITPQIISTTNNGTRTFNFNGGVLEAAGSSASYMNLGTGNQTANVRNGGALINSNGFAITIPQVLSHSNVAGDNAIDGGLTKSGAGSLTLTAANTYTGATNVTGGTLILSGSGSVNSSSGININGSGARFTQAGGIAVIPTITVTNGTLDGNGTVGSVNVLAGGAVANGVGGIGNLATSSMNFVAAGSLNFTIPGTTATTPVMSTGALSTSNGSLTSAGKVTVNATNSVWAPATYDLMSYSTLTGPGASDFVKGTIAGLSGRQSATLQVSGGFIALVVAGDTPTWTGALDGTWNTTTQSSPKNWKLATAGTPTDYVDGDVVTFADGASNPNVNINLADVNPLSVTFTNNGTAYNFTGAHGIAGNTSLVLNGTSSVSLGTVNSYTGGTFLNNGTLNVNNANALGAGALNIANGTTIDNTSGAPITLATNNAQNWNGDFTFNGTNDLNLGTGAVTLNAARTITTNGSANLTVGGAIGGSFGISKSGTGTLILAGNNTYVGSTIIHQGTLAVANGTTGTLNNGANSDIQIAPGGSDNGTLLVSGGVVNANRVIIGGDSANTAGGTGKLVQTGGTINSQQWFTVGSGNAAGNTFPIGEYDISGGTMNLISQQMEVANFYGTTGTVNMTGGNINLENNTSIALGANNLAGDGTFNQSAGNVTFYSNTTAVGGTGILYLGKSNSLAGTYTYNLNGGVLTVPQIQQTAGSGGTGIFNFNGGTLRAAKTNATFMTGLSQANVQSGGAIIDDNGFAITIGQNLNSGGGVDGGLTKLGSGNLTLTGSSTYTGPTNINNGILLLTGAGSINGSSGINVNNGSKLIHLSTTAISPTVTISNGSLSGSNTSLNAVVVNSLATNTISNGNSDTGILTIGSLTFNGAAIANVTLAGASATNAPGIVTTNLTTSGGSGTSAGHVTINAVNSLWNNGVYDLIGYSSIAGVGFNDFVLGNVTGLSPRQSAVLTNVTGDIALTVSGGAVPVWTGALNNSWTTATLASPKNWKIQGGSATDFITGDTVLFDDTATGNTNVTIADAGGVAPTSTTFNNSNLNYTISNSGAAGITTGLVVKSGTGNLTLAGANSYAGGTTLNAGTINVNNAASLGTGPIVINGGAFGNTSGADITETGNGAVTIAGDFTFNGASNLSLGTGAVTLSGSGTSRTINVASNTFGIGPITSAANYGLIKTGPGTLTMPFSGAGASTIGGTLDVEAGTLQIGANDFHAGGLIGNGTIENGSGTSRWLFVQSTANQTFGGVLQNGSGAGRLGLTLNAPNVTLTLTGANTYSDATNVQAGTLIFSGTTNNTSAVDNIGNVAGTNGILVVGPGSTFGANDNPGQFTSVLAVGGNATSAGDIRLGFANSSVSVGAQFGLGTGAGGYAGYTQTAGNLSVASFVVVGFNNDRAVFNQSSGNVTIATNLMTIAAGGTGSIGVTTLSGGNFTSAATTGYGPTIGGVLVGEFGNGTLNVSGSANVTLAGHGLTLGANANSSGTANLDGGTVNTNIVAQGTGTGVLNLNGATIKATAANATFMQGLTSATIYGGGVTIDDGGFNVTVAQPLLGATGNGVSNTGLSASGTGFIDTPIVTVSGDGTGATAVAKIDASGNLTGITITNPGQGYTNASFALLGGGVSASGSISGTPALVANTPGALTKNGAGNLTLTGANTYAGGTSINAGTLIAGNVQALGTGAVAIHTGGKLQLQSGLAQAVITPAVTFDGTTNNWSGALDVTNDKLIVEAVTNHATALANLQNQAHSVITSSTQASNYGVAVIDNQALATPFTTFGGRPVDNNSILVASELLGDTNADGTINSTDLNTVLSHFGAVTAAWTSGNFDGSATIDLTDLAYVLNNFGLTNPNAFAATGNAGDVTTAISTPEPASLAIMGLGLAMLLRRSRRSA